MASPGEAWRSRDPYNARDMKTIVLALIAAGLAGCVSTSEPMTASAAAPARQRISAAAVSRDGATLWYAMGGRGCDVRSLSVADRAERSAFALDWCPESIVTLEDGTLVMSDGRARGAWKRADGTDVVSGRILAAAGTTSFVEARDGRIVWVDGTVRRELGGEGMVRWPTFVPGSAAVLSIVKDESGERLVSVTAEGRSDASPVFGAIDSFAVAPRGDEIVYSALRDGGFDVAIASPDGKQVNWIPADRGDEVGVTWAPRGNKVSYLIRRPDGTLVRSVHVPTSFQLTFETVFEAVRILAWEPRAEKIVMVLDGPSRGPHIDWVEYSGANRVSLSSSAFSVNRDPERLIAGGEGVILLPPPVVRYGETLPLFVVMSNEPLAWDERVRDLDALGGGIVIAPAATTSGERGRSELLSQLRWVARDKVVVLADSEEAALAIPRSSGWTVIYPAAPRMGESGVDVDEQPSGGARVKVATWEAALQYIRGSVLSTR